MKLAHAATLSPLASRMHHRIPALAWIALGGLLTGSLDLLFAWLWWAPTGATPGRILQIVAGWFIGREAALAGGLATVLLGTGVHYGLMTATVAGYCGLRRSWPQLRQHLLVAGASYGAAVYVCVHLLVVPLVLKGSLPQFRPAWMLACLLVFMLMVGIPAAWFAERWRQAQAFGPHRR